MTQTIYKRMKIVVSAIVTLKGASKHLVQVMDGDYMVHSETTDNIDERDRLVWQLAETYNALDIEVSKDKDVYEEFQLSEIPSIPVLDEDDAVDFFEDNQSLVYSRILQAAEEGIELGLDELRLFELNGTGVHLTSRRADWKDGIEKAIQYFIEVEEYERCVVGRHLLAKI
jgi:hypothetical protein